MRYVRRQIREKADKQKKYNVFVAEYKPHDAKFGAETVRQVALVQQAGQVFRAIDDLSKRLGLMHCFVPAGLYTCKPLEYPTQVLGDTAGLQKFKDYVFLGHSSTTCSAAYNAPPTVCAF